MDARKVGAAVRRGGTAAGAALTRRLLSAPLTVAFALLLAIGPALPVRPVHVGQLAAQPFALLGSLFWTPDPAAWIAAVLGVLVLGPIAERRLGAARFGLAMLAGHVGAVLATVALARGVAALDPPWGAMLAHGPVGGPWPGLIVALAEGAADMPTLWRRRLWTLGVTLAGTSAAFSGAPQDNALLFAALGGVGLASALVARRRRRAPVSAPAPLRAPGTRGERRLLVAVAVAGVVAGTVVSLGSPHLVGPLSGTRLLFAQADVSPEAVAAACADPGRARECLRAAYVLRSAGPGQILLAALPLVLQLVLADGLRRGRRAALVGTLALQGLLAALAATHLGAVWATLQSTAPRAHDTALVTRLVLPVLVPLALFVLVATHARLFPVRAAGAVHRRALAAVGAAVVVVVAAVLGAGLAVPAQFPPDPTPAALVTTALLAQLPSTALTVFTPFVLPNGPVADAVLVWLPILPWLVALAAAWRILRAPAERPGRRADVLDEVRAVAPAEASLAWMGSWEGNRVWHSSTTRAAVAYRDAGGVALTVADPVCAPADLPHVVAEFADYCSRQSLIPALYSVHASAADAARARGWVTVQVAEETLLPLGDVKFSGKRFQDVRTAVNRAAKEGVRAEWTTWADAAPAVRRQIREVSEAWVADKALPEMGFTLGGLEELQDPQVRLLVALDEDGLLHGVTSWLPIYDAGRQVGLTLDFMRRRDGGFRPVVEFLLARAALDAQEEGLSVLSLSGAPLARTGGGEADLGPLDRLLDALGALLEPVYGFRSLHAFKAKFGPVYRPMHLCFPDMVHLPAVGAALAEAYVPGMGPVDMLRTAQALRRSARPAPARPADGSSAPTPRGTR